MKKETKKLFINLTNHPSEKWSEHQRSAAEMYGNILDMPFPDISPMADALETDRIAEELVESIIDRSPNAVLCQGEMTVCFRVVNKLKAAGITVLCATTERRVIMEETECGQSIKKTVFSFVRFREY